MGSSGISFIPTTTPTTIPAPTPTTIHTTTTTTSAPIIPTITTTIPTTTTGIQSATTSIITITANYLPAYHIKFDFVLLLRVKQDRLYFIVASKIVLMFECMKFLI